MVFPQLGRAYLMKSSVFIVTLLLLSFSYATNAHVETPNNKATLWFEQSDLPLNEKLHVKVLDNGMRVVVIQNVKPKKAISIRMRVGAGSLQETGKQPGLAHFLEHMAFNGSTNVPEGDMIQILERHGLSFGKDSNAETNFKQTVYMLDLPKNDKETLSTALFLMRETASELTLDKDAIARELPVISSEVRERTTLDLRILKDWSSYVLQGANIIDRIPLGTLEGMKEVNQSRLKAFYHNYYTPNHTTLVIAGDVDVQSVFSMVEKQFASWDNKGHDIVPYSKQVMFPTTAEARVFKDSNVTTHVEFNYLEPINRAPDSRAKRVEEFMLYVANQALQYRLETTAFASQGELLSPYVGSYNQFDVVTSNQLSVATKSDQWQAGVDMLESSLRQAVKYGFSKQEIQRQLDKYHTLLKLDAEATKDTLSSSYAAGVVNDINNKAVSTSNEFALSLFESDVIPKEISAYNQIFNKHWSDKHPRIYVMDKPQSKVTAKTVLEAYKDSESTQVKPYAEAEKVQFAYQNFGQPATAKLIEKTAFGDVTRYRFDNGVYLNVKPTEFESNSVYISVRVGKGKLDLAKKDAPLATLFDSAFIAGGLEAHDINDLRSIFSGRQIGASYYLTDDAIEGHYRVPPQDTLDQLKVAAAFLTHPGYRPSGHALAVQSLKSVYDSYPTTPEGVLGFNVGKVLYQDDPRWEYPKVEVIDKLPLTALKQFVDRSVNQGPIEVSLLGNITQQQAVDYVAQTFGALNIKAQDFVPRPRADIQLNVGEHYTLYHQGEQNTALASGYFSLPDGRDYKRVVGFAVLRSILQLRVNDAIREKTGKAYSPWVDSSQSLLYKDYGYLSLNSNTTVDNVDIVFDIYRKLIRDIQETGVSNDELKRAVMPMIDGIEQSYENNGFWFGLMYKASSYPENLANEQTFKQLVSAVTAADVQQLAKQIVLKDMITVAVLPEEKEE